jgi:predicted NBD/HSP70 family sugar kinase
MSEPQLGERARVGRVFDGDGKTDAALQQRTDVDAPPAQVRRKQQASVGIDAAGKAHAHSFEHDLRMRGPQRAHGARELARERRGIVRCGPRDLLAEARVDAGEPHGRLLRAQLDGDDAGALDVEMEKTRPPSAQRVTGPLRDPPLVDQLVDDAGHGAALQAGSPREVGAGHRRVAADEVERDPPVDDAGGFARRHLVENSMKACILAQVWALSSDVQIDGPVAFVNVSDGVGVGIAVDGKLLRGANNTAGEFGHVPLNMYGPLCSCGRRGCWEAYASNRAISARYAGADLSWTGEPDLTRPTVEEIVSRGRAGEGRALETLRETGYYLGRGFAMLVKSIDPSRIYVGGEITLAWDVVEPMVRDALREQALTREAEDVAIRVVQGSEHPRLRGAAALVLTPAFAAPTVA